MSLIICKIKNPIKNGLVVKVIIQRQKFSEILIAKDILFLLDEIQYDGDNANLIITKKWEKCIKMVKMKI